MYSKVSTAPTNILPFPIFMLHAIHLLLVGLTKTIFFRGRKKNEIEFLFTRQKAKSTVTQLFSIVALDRKVLITLESIIIKPVPEIIIFETL